MINLSAQIRRENEDVKALKGEERLFGVLYGFKIKNVSLDLNYKEFEKIYKEAGESSLISLKIEGEGNPYKVLIHEIQRDPVSDNFIHVDFYQPSLTEKTEANIPLVFEGKSEAVEKLEGTLVKNIDEIEVKALPQDLPHEIKANIDRLKTFSDRVKVSDLDVPQGVEILKDSEEIVASVVPPTRVEEELEVPIEEKVEDVEKVKEEKTEKEDKGEVETKEEKDES